MIAFSNDPKYPAGQCDDCSQHADQLYKASHINDQLRITRVERYCKECIR